MDNFIKSESIQARFQRFYKLAIDNVLIVVSVLVILPLIMISGFVHPVADDFNFANLKSLGFIELEKYFYMRGGGRYSQNFLYFFSLLPDSPVKTPISSEKLVVYRMFPVLVISLMVLSLCHLMGSLFVSIKNGQRIWISLGLLVAFLSFRHPSSIYWHSGAVPYGLAMSSVILFVSMLIRLSEKSDGMRFLLAAATGIISIGLNESALVVVNILMFIVCVHMFATSNSNRYRFLALFGIMILFSLIAIISPGNWVRDQRAAFENEKNIFYALLKSFERGLSNSLYWFTVSALVNLLLIDYIRRKGLTLKPMLARIEGMLVLFMTIACVILPFFPNAWARGGVNPDHRVVDFIQYIFVAGLFLYFLHRSLRWGNMNSEGVHFHLSNPLRLIVILSLICSLYVSTDVKTQVKDLLVKAPAFDKEMISRYQMVATSNQDTVIVPPVKNIPLTIYFDDIKADSENWRNKCAAKYFNKKHIRLSSPNRYLETLYGIE